MSEESNRIMIVDDNPSIHEDFRKVLPAADDDDEQLDDLLRDFLGTQAPAVETQESGLPAGFVYELDHAYQGEEALRLVEQAAQEGRPYALIFMDVRMPPGWDGIETIKRIWAEYPDIEMVICTAYSDYSWTEILDRIGHSDQLQFVRKPFDVVSVRQMALALTRKWNLTRQARDSLRGLQDNTHATARELAANTEKLAELVNEIKQLQALQPMCASCHEPRDFTGYYDRLHAYLQARAPAEVTEMVCPDCRRNVLTPLIERGEQHMPPPAST